VSDRRERGGRARRLEGRGCVRRAQEARLQSLAMQLAESDCTLRVTNTHLCSADSARRRRPPHSSSRLAWWPPGARFSRPPAAGRGVKPAARGSRCTVARGSWLRAAPADVIPIMSPQVSHESSSPLSRGAAPLSFRFLLPLPSSLVARGLGTACASLSRGPSRRRGGGCGPTYCDPRSRLRGTRHRSTPWWVAPAAGGR
jgi:hypothetical protein